MDARDARFTERMIDRGEYAPAARGMSPMDTMGQWLEVNGADHVIVYMRGDNVIRGAVTVTRNRRGYVDSIGVSNGSRSLVIVTADHEPPMRDIDGSLGHVHPQIIRVTVG